jgi:hypothetical protein
MTRLIKGDWSMSAEELRRCLAAAALEWQNEDTIVERVEAFADTIPGVVWEEVPHVASL